MTIHKLIWRITLTGVSSGALTQQLGPTTQPIIVASAAEHYANEMLVDRRKEELQRAADTLNLGSKLTFAMARISVEEQ